MINMHDLDKTEDNRQGDESNMKWRKYMVYKSRNETMMTKHFDANGTTW